MKYLRNLPNHNAYEAFINGQNYTEIQLEKNDIISYCKTEQHIHYNPYIPHTPTPPTFLDILYSDANGNLSFTSEVLPISEGKTPIALCIAPPNFFGDNEPARWMSLKYMSNSSPFTGSNELNMCCGNKQVDLIISNMQTTHDNGAASGYMLVSYRDNSSQSNTIPNVINLNNEWNLSELGTVNTYAVTDKDGKGNTSIMLAATSSQPNWETDSSITNDGDHAGYSPAACVCARYHTLGTQEGDWYLGSCGEMAMIIAQKIAIRSKFEAIANVYENGECYTSVIGDNQYLTSTEYNADNIYSINLSNASINYIGKDSNSGVIALLQYFTVSAIPNNVIPNNSEPSVLAAPSLLDILYSDASGNLSYSSNVLPVSEGKTPIALCIAEPGFFGANEPGRWMSLKYMSCNTPETGTVNGNDETMFWGNDGIDVSTIANIEYTHTGGDWRGILLDFDPDNDNNITTSIPSLFDANNEWNITVLGAVNQYAVTDIDGKDKTDKLLDTVSAQPNWLTDNTIQDEDQGCAPAACCCARYHTLGTQAGDWYLGASGEMSMIAAKISLINTKLASINAVYPNNSFGSLIDNIHWTSTEANEYSVFLIQLGIGQVYSYDKYYPANTIALLQYYIPTILASPMDILYSDAQGNLSFDSAVLPASEGKTPIALCIAPQGFFGTNEPARWMSLKFMDYRTAPVGSLEFKDMYFGFTDNGNNFNIPTIDDIEYLDKDNNYYGAMTVDYYDNTDYYPVSSVINENNEWNLSELGAANMYAMTDIDGKNKSTEIIKYATADETWRTDTYIDNNYANNYATAVCSCYRYHTLGTQEGDWYLGACGEMCMALAYKTNINTKLAAINAVYPNDCISSLDNNYYWTSTEASRSWWTVCFDDGFIESLYGNDSHGAIALLQY